MNFAKKAKFYFFPILFLVLPALAGILLEIYNRYYRGISTPFLIPALGLILVSLFFWVKRKWAYIFLMFATVLYTGFFLKHLFWQNAQPSFWVYNYRDWALNTQTGKIRLTGPLGNNSPVSGAYVSCNFSFGGWRSFLNFQPILCTAFDPQLRIKMFLHDQSTDAGQLREIQINQFRVDRKSLLGEPLDRSALRMAFIQKKGRLSPKFTLKAIYQVFERELSEQQTRIVETFARDAQGRLKSFTESPLLKFSNRDVFAVYNSQGYLVHIPRMKEKSFSFPAKIDIRSYQDYHLPKILKSGDLS